MGVELDPNGFIDLVVRENTAVRECVVRQTQTTPEPDFWVLDHMQQETCHAVWLACFQMTIGDICDRHWIIREQFIRFHHMLKTCIELHYRRLRFTLA